MFKIQLLAIIFTVLLVGCSDYSDPTQLPVENKTNISSFECGTWYRNENLYKSTCLVDNISGAEQRPVTIVAYNNRGAVVGEAYIGTATVGMKVKINKALLATDEVASFTVEVSR